ncbi:gliding motility-associated C-terminal domain-containing protein [Flavobacterium tyrosinilyticum]|uniref:Ig-like domain-containing protein n=1 Tax=Flavobacterium tyrosinilyticum TaxID=1658740 RepID=UPI00202F8EED|nr:gliding motility-associated C-terminal domain-containing protein [Flavobacterium tyrosinilyticum]MCM0666672.1 gliding motility-associated C-terminal domain-containing protein [Flavobacterium tyrosinilyticum]
MKKKFTFCSLNPQMRLLGLLTLFFICSNAFSQTICRPVSQTNSAGGGLLCLGVDVNSPANAYDSAGLSTYATLTNGVAVLGCFAEETMTLNQTARAGDQVAIYFGTGNGLLDLTLLSNATIQAKNSGTNVGSSVALNSPLLNLNLLSGNTVAVAKFPITGDTNQIQIQVGGGLLSLLVSLRVYDVRLEFAQPTVSGGLSQTVCAGVPTTLTATPAAGTSLAWYSSEFSTTALAVGNTYTTPALAANTTYYIGITRAAGCEGNVRVPVVLNVSNPAIPAISNVGTTVCSTGATQQTTLSVVNAAPGTIYNWYSSATGGPALASGTTYSPIVPLGTTQFFVEAAIGSCVSSRTPVSVVSTAVPITPTVLTQSVTIQSGQNATLNASTTEIGAQLNWYETSTGGTAVATNTATFTTPILTATKTYYVEAQSPNGNCVSATRVPVTVTVQPAALGGCLEASSQVTSQVGVCLLCNATNPNFSVDGNPATATRLTVPANVLGSMQQTLQFTNPGKAGDIVDVDLELPGGLADVQLLSVISLATYNGATYNNDRVAINNPLITLQLLSGTRYRASVTAGANFDRVEVRLGGVLGLLTNLDIYQAAYRYKASVVSGNTAICSGQTATLNANLALGETIRWYDALTGGNLLSSTASFTTPALTANTTYYVELTRNGCVNSVRNPFAVTVDSPVAPTAISTVPANLCSGETTTITIQSPVAGTTYNWYDAATGGTLVFTGTSFVTPNLTVPTTYYIEAVIGTCLSARTAVNVNVNPRPAAPVPVSSSVIIQSGQNVQLSVVSSPGVSYLWYDAPTGGTLLQGTGSNTYIPNPVLTANKTFYVEAVSTASDCRSTSRAAINVIVTNTVSTCLQPSTQAITVDPGLLCVLCNGVNGPNAVDGNPNTFSSLTITAGVLNSYIQQQLNFLTPGQAGDIIDVELELPGGLADIALLGSVSIGTSLGGVENPGRLAVNNSLLNLQVLSGNKFKVSYPTTAAFDRVDIRLGALVGLLTTVNIYGASYRFPNATITGATAPICAGQSANLSATSTGGETFQWYDSPTLGNVVSVAPTAPLTTTTTYYLESTRGGCVNSLRQAVTVNVLPIPTAANIVITSPVEATCSGEAVLTPSSDIAGVQFKYYKDQNKVTEIVDGSVDGSITFAKDPITGVLSLTGLTTLNSPYNLYISAVNGGTCENVNGDLKLVTVNFPSTTPLTVITTPLVACGTANLANAITNFDSAATYTFYDPLNNVMTADAAANVTVSGIYSIQAQGATSTCPSARQSVTVTINAVPTLVVTNPQESVNVGADVALNATSTGTVTWFNPQGVALAGPPFTTGSLNVPGVYTYTAVATLGTCSVTATKVINVIDLTSCQNLTERVYASGESEGFILTGSVSNNANAIDGNPQTFSTITTGLGLLGIGTTWQNLTWATPIAKGTPVTVKLGSEYSLLAVGENLSVVGTIGGNLIGAMQPVSGSLLKLISGDNTYEFTFVPSDASGPQDYDGIRIVSSSILSLAQNTKVFEAHYNKPVTAVTCTPGDIQDIFYGATDINLPIGAATALIGVSDAWNVADNDVTTFATMYSGVGVAAAADLTVQFKTPSVLSDTLRIVVSKPGSLLSVNLLTGFSIQRYLGNVAVGAPIQNTSTLLSIKLLPGNSLAMVLVSSPTEIYDRVRIRLGGVAGVLDFLRVHTVERTANTTVIGADPQNKITVCPGSEIELQIPEVACSTYRWYDAETGGNLVASGPTFTLPDNLTAGIYKYYVQPVRYGCENYARGEVTVEVKASAPVNALTDITLNGGTATSICSASGTVTLATGLSGTPILTNPVYHWYSLNGTTSQLIPGETTAQLIVNGLAPGTYTYFVGVSSDELCETAAADRKQITFTILPPSIGSDILVDDVTVCPGLSASLTPTAPALTSPVFTWYLDAAKTQPITNGAIIGGVTYAIDAAGILTATGLTKAVSPITYYVAVSSTNTCENLAGTLQDAVIIVSDPNTPTTTNDTQNFCLSTDPTVANIQVNESNVIWYDAAIGGNVIASTTPLVSRIYYGAATDALTGCESSVRLEVTVNVNDPGTPTLVTAGVQNFCQVDQPTFASIQFNQANIVWYTALTGGTLITSNTALTTGQYFAAISDPATGCESNSRLTVDVIVSDPGTPTLVTAGTQTFCKEDLPTFASIQTNETNIVWYTALTGGTLIPSTTALTTGQYFAAISDPTTGCESATRLTVDVIVNDPGTPTLVTAGTQNFCLANAPTFASIQTNETNIVWYTALTGGTLIPSATALTTGQYFAAISDPATGCESASRLTVDVIVNDPGTPTLVTAGVQNFCQVDQPTFASIQTNETNIVWYTAITGGTLIPSTTALTTGQYFAAISDPATGCESNSRLTVDVIVSDPGTPTLVTAGTQTFCKEDLPTFASVQFNQANIVWYTALTGGTLIPSTTALTTGQYFAAISDPATGCESATRLTVDVIVNDPGTPTLVTAGTQNFCLANAPTFASIQTNETNIVWYTALTGGTLIPSATALTTGQYFAAISDPATGCESAARLTVDVIVNDPGTPTLVTAGTQNFCVVNAPTFASVQFNQTNIVWYTALTGGTVIAPTTALTTGQYFAAISDPTTGCESNSRLTVDVIVSDPGTPTLVTAGTQTFCKEDLPTFASVQFNQANIVWYTALTGGTLIPSTTALTTGQYFAAISDPATGCESVTRLTVDVIVNDPGTPTLVTAGTQNFCLANAPTFASIQTNETNIVWYTALTGGTVIAPTTALTTGQYFASISDPTTGCESASRLTVDVIVNDPGTPTLVTAGTQNFCLVNAPTFASVQFNQTNIVWYTALTGGTLIPSATALTTGQYFAAILDPSTGCESASRLTVNVNVTDPATPTTTATAQTFCTGTNPTVANIQVNESNVVWYTTQTGGTALAATTALTTTTYFGAIKDPVTGCESSVRLQVAVTVGNTLNPTTNSTVQTFCSANAPTIANIQVNENNVTWFTAATGGTAIPAGTALTSGVYFGNIVDPSGCESSTRLQVTVTLVNPSPTPTTANTTQNFCTLNSPTVANIQVNEANVVWYSTATGGTAIAPTTALVTGTYYGAVSSAIGCENPARLAVTVNVNSPSVITTPRTTQTFCLSALPTLASIFVNETNVVWYASATGGTALANTTPLTATTYYAGSLTNTFNGCDNGPRLGVTIAFENDSAVQLATTDDTPCVFKGVTYSIANGKSNYVWTINGGTIVSGGGTNDGSVTVSWSDIGPGKVTVAYVNNCDERTIKTLDVTVASCSDLTITHTVDNPTPNFGDKVTFTITVNNVGEGDFINTIVSDLLPSGLQLVSSSATAGTYDPATQLWTIPTLTAGQSVVLTVVAEVLSSGNYTSVATVEISTPLDVDASNNSASVTLEPICLTVYNEFTPNNDGKNDLFRIDCIESYPNNELKVFNRYGALVYSKTRYENDWNGTANVSGVVNRGDMLPTGTYFYVITIGDGTVKKGWLSIMR